ncbi:MAG: cytidine deaminase [Firmicutes bacterium]|nr:cytidine deaminase [Bacillota bacterium]
MNKELIQKLVVHAKEFAENAYCPISGVPEGASLLVEGTEGGSIILGGCNVETPYHNVSAGELVIEKAISEGISKFVAICFWGEKSLPYPSGNFLQFAAEFNPELSIIVANDDTYSIHKLHELLPIRRLSTGGED